MSPPAKKGDHTVEAVSSWLDRVRFEGSDEEGLVGLERDILPAYLLQSRWYAAKDAGPPVVRLEELIPFDGPHEARLGILRVEPKGQPPQRYFLPLLLAWRSAPSGAPPIARVQRDGTHGSLLDALAADGFVQEVIRAIEEATSGASKVPSGLAVRGSTALSRHHQLASAEIGRSGAEQSNTSLRIGDVAMLKALRKLQAGTHPELEMSRFLTEVSGFENTPALLGSVELVPQSGPATALFVLQALIRNEGDAWTYVLDRLASQLKSGESGKPLADPLLLRLARKLGQRTAELHHALATPTDNAAFRPEVATRDDMQQWAESVRAMARTSLDALASSSILKTGCAGDAERLLKRRSDLMARIDSLAPDDVRVARMRLHGDYHLGQVLVSGNDVFIVDFEGEPMRSLEERRAKHSPLRDVAGMLRSISYAAAAAGRRLPDEDRRREEVRLAAWTTEVSAAFLETYQDSIQGCPGYPDAREDAARLVQLFLLEKALYEIAYEVANRPDWVRIPVTGVLELLAAGPPN